MFNKKVFNNTVRPLLSAPLLVLCAELDYPRFLRPNLSTPNLYEIRSDLYDSHLYYPQFLRSQCSSVRLSTADNRGLTIIALSR